MWRRWFFVWGFVVFFFQAEDGIRDAQESRGLGDVYKRQGAKPGTGEPDGSDPDRFSILFVCTGNICRSPVAEYLTQAALSIRLGPAAGQVLVTSAGTWGHEGAAMEPFALQVPVSYT